MISSPAGESADIACASLLRRADGAPLCFGQIQPKPLPPTDAKACLGVLQCPCAPSIWIRQMLWPSPLRLRHAPLYIPLLSAPGAQSPPSRASPQTVSSVRAILCAAKAKVFKKRSRYFSSFFCDPMSLATCQSKYASARCSSPSYRTSISVSPFAGAVCPRARRSPVSIALRIAPLPRLPVPTSISVPAMMRTML